MKGLSVMYDYKWKKYGIIMSVTGLLLMIAERVKGFIIFHKLNALQHYQVFEWIMLYGLAWIIYCREKNEDERVKAIRLKSFQMAFTLMLCTMLAYCLTSVTVPDNRPGNQLEVLFMHCGAGIIFYLLMFNVGLHFDELWEYNDVGLWQNLKNIPRDKWSILVYLLLCTVMIVFLYFVNSPR